MRITTRVIRTSSLPPAQGAPLKARQVVQQQSPAPLAKSPLAGQPFFGFYPPLNIRFGIGIDPDYERLKDIQKGKLREDLRDFMSPGDLDVLEGGKVVKIPRTRIDQPHFTRGKPQEGGGVGSGDGEVGDELQPGEEPGEGKQAGQDAGEHGTDAWTPSITRSEIARLFPDYSLPNLKPKGTENVKQTREVWDTRHRYGQELLLDPTIKKAMLREVAERAGRDDDFDPETMDLEEVLKNLMPEDILRRSYRPVEKPQANVRIYFLMDVSGSMGDKEKETARRLNFYIETIIGHQIGQMNAELRDEVFTDDMWGEGLEVVYVVHDTAAKKVSAKEFYTTQESGGTSISPAYDLIKKDILENSPPAEWNNYIFHYSDGDNWGDDNGKAIELVKQLKPLVNEFGFVLTDTPYGSGGFEKELVKAFGKKDPIVRTAEIDDLTTDQIDDVLKVMLTEREGDGTP